MPLTSSITLDANLTWMEAKFRSGTYSGVDLAGKQVPLVPKWLANAGVTWRPTDALCGTCRPSTSASRAWTTTRPTSSARN